MARTPSQRGLSAATAPAGEDPNSAFAHAGPPSLYLTDPITRQVNDAFATAQMKYSGWGPFLDALNAAAPGGIQTPSGRGNPMPGLQNLPPIKRSL